MATARITASFAWLVFTAITAVAQPAKDDAIAAFAGSWEGKWSGGPVFVFAVENIEGRRAELVYRSKSLERRTGAHEGGSGRVMATLAEDGSLRATLVNGAAVVYRLSEDGRSIAGEYRHESVQKRAVFTRPGAS
jgi:hypothetical protein